MSLPVSAAPTEPQTSNNNDIVILHTNDVHCAIDDGIGYAASLPTRLKWKHLRRRQRHSLDAGDAIQGGAIGTLSDGAFLVDIMNQVATTLPYPVIMNSTTAWTIS